MDRRLAEDCGKVAKLCQREMGMSGRAVKRLSMTFLEMVAEAILLGVLFWLLLLPKLPVPDLKNRLGVLLVSPAPVILILYLQGYYLMRPLVGLLGRVGRAWIYSAIAALLFAVQIYVAIVRFRPDISPEAKAVTMPFLFFGTAVVFCCAFLGDRLLRHRMITKSTLPGVIPLETAE